MWGKFLLFLFIIGVFPFFSFSAFALSTCPDGVCYQIYINNMGAITYGNADVNSVSSCPPVMTKIDYIYSAQRIVTFRVYAWDPVVGAWGTDIIYFWNSRPTKLADIDAVVAAFGLTAPSAFDQAFGVDGRLIYPDGCGSSPPPPCLDSEKLCEQLRLVDQNNIIKYASYVTYENRNASMGTTSSLEYRADDFDSNLDYTAYMPIGIDPATDCFCPDDNHLPQDLQNNFSVISPGETIADAAANDPFFCAQQCFPKGYIYTDGKCICVDDGAKTDSASTSPGAPTSETAANAPADPTDSAQQLAAVNENLASVINQGNQTNDYLSNIADNLVSSVNNQQGIVDGLGGLGDQLGNDLSGLGGKLDTIQDQQSQGYNLEGSAELPTDNIYGPVVDDVQEDSLSDSITQYLASGIPVLSYINGSGATIANATSSMDVSIWGGTVTFDLSPMASILDAMGYFLTAISMIVAFFIIVGRG